MLRLPRVSICLLTYNRAHVLSTTLELLLSQTHSDFELLINDDCSPDHTGDVCQAVARRDDRVRYFRNPRNFRYADNQNVAILRANCEHVAIVHDSDVYHPNVIEEWTRALMSHPSAALVFNAAHRMNSRREVVGTYTHPYEPLVPGRELFDEVLVSAGSPIFGIVMVRRSMVMAAGPFDPRLQTLADVDMWLRLMLAHDIAYIREPLYAVAPREASHHNNFTNWRIRSEGDLIYELNWQRRIRDDASQAEGTRRAVARLVWKLRRQQLLACARHGELAAFWRGIQYIKRQSRFGSSAEPDTVTTWPATAQRLGEHAASPAF